jgi:5-hydroxyisourate hydrolase
MSITTHVLDTSIGRPAAGVGVRLEHCGADGLWCAVGDGTTDGDGRLRTLVPAGSAVGAGTYRLTFETAAYFEQRSVESFYPRVVVEFTIGTSDPQHHVPLLISPFGYSTYRGS